MFKRFAGALSATMCATMLVSAAHAGDVTGAGSTFVEPIVKTWAEAYSSKTGDHINYQGIGSSGGITAIKGKTVDFAGTDKPLTAADQQASGLYMFPVIIGGVVPIVNIPGVRPNQMRLTGPVLADIYEGKIRNWDDARIAHYNPGMHLPNMPITVVHRSDGSGTTFIFSSYLSKVSQSWKVRVGGNDSVNWPVGVGGKGNPGVSAVVKQTTGAIGYVEYWFAVQNHENSTQMASHDRVFLYPKASNFAGAASHANWTGTPGNAVMLLDEPGPTSWPISGASFILVDKDIADANKGATILKFFDWSFKNGGAMAAAKDYVPLPANVTAMIRKQWAAEVKSGGNSVYVAH
ncbi:MAG: phosphate ABC transporter substrate-binding protein PstS [Alphaproteobacteria bacterium]|nr:phosphate ABC transporter substrate-binding protein PstS [Alphaproteobacteria bacterium]MDE2042643.1 phosphate ABC transporter substrate-binding protein PstS [Alphaproteobacteria bacterium]MDE2341324.1 phosphate ABC transporter substrate-binding protein PstS [Alphaproteobacteria bacterium]